MSGLTQPLPDPPPDGPVDSTGPATAGSVAEEARRASPLLDLTLRLEESEALDPVVDRAAAVWEPLLGPPDVKALLGGRWLGHAVHPLLTDLPIGFWTSATVLDVIGGRRSATAAQRLVALGVLSAVPAALTGWSDWLSVDRPLRRVGVVHAASNGAAVALYSLSWLARRKGHRARGIVLGMAGGTVASVAGHLGGHMTVGRGAGVVATEDALGAARDG